MLQSLKLPRLLPGTNRPGWVVARRAARSYSDGMTTTPPDPTPVPPCPRCAATHVVRNGPNTAGTPTFRCRACGRRFVAAPQKGPVADDRQTLVRRLLHERLALRAIARATGLSRSWLQGFVNRVYEETPWEPGPLKKTPPARS